MKAKIEFDLPEENQDFELAFKANDIHGLVNDLDQELRSYLKYGTLPFGITSNSFTSQELAESIRSWILSECRNRCIPQTF